MNTSQQPTLQERLAVASNLMSLQMQPFATPISSALVDGTAIHVGTGGYVEWRRNRLLLTNEHVAREVKKVGNHFLNIGIGVLQCRTFTCMSGTRFHCM